MGNNNKKKPSLCHIDDVHKIKIHSLLLEHLLLLSTSHWIFAYEYINRFVDLIKSPLHKSIIQNWKRFSYMSCVYTNVNRRTTLPKHCKLTGARIFLSSNRLCVFFLVLEFFCPSNFCVFCCCYWFFFFHIRMAFIEWNIPRERKKNPKNRHRRINKRQRLSK